MQVRRLARENMLDVERIRAIAFLGSLDEEAAARSIEEMPEKDIATEWGCFDEENRLIACVKNHDFKIWFDGQVVKMGGIGGVSSLPEHRYGGAIKSIFGSLLRTAREEGEVFSSLYPFSHEFYRKVGYENALPVKKYEFPTTLLAGYKHTGWVRRMEVGESVEPMKRVYDGYARQYNLMVLREDRRFRIGNPFKAQHFTMLLGDEGGELAYLKYRREYKDGRNVLCVDDMAYLGQAGLRAILGYLARMTADFAWVRMPLSDDAPLHAMIPRPYELNCQTDYSVMVRVTYVQAALERMLKPEDVEFTIQVTDDFLPENSGVYRVSRDGVNRTETAADLQVSVQALAPMLLGTLPLEQALYRRDVCLNGNRDALVKAFPAKPTYLTDHF